MKYLGWLIALISFMLSAGILFVCGSKELALLQVLVALLCGVVMVMMQYRNK